MKLQCAARSEVLHAYQKNFPLTDLDRIFREIEVVKQKEIAAREVAKKMAKKEARLNAEAKASAPAAAAATEGGAPAFTARAANGTAATPAVTPVQERS
jgi:hypothetical protein